MLHRSSLCILQAVLFAALLLPARSHGQSPLLLELRKETGAMFKDETACERVLKQLSSADTRNDAVLKGYLGAATIARASHAVNPFRKLAYFNDGKELLESAVATDNSSLELRFLRLSIQVNAPSFLGYRAAIAEDHAYIDANLDRVASHSFRESIVRFIAKAESEGKL